MIEATGLTKRYGNVTAVNNVTFTCRRGEIVGFLGPNGAGKTTTMRMLAGYTPPTVGKAYISGYDTISQSMQARQRLGYLPETVPLYGEMRVEDYLAFVGRLRQVDNLWERVDDALAAVDMLDRAEDLIGQLSKGYRQRVGIAQALIHDPDVLILDEPTIGLDPAQIREVRALIGQLGQQHTVLLSTHILSEVQQICNRVIIIVNGSIWADLPLEQADGGGDEIMINVHVANPAHDTAARLTGVDGVRQVIGQGGRLTLFARPSQSTRTAVAETIVDAGWGLLEMSVSRTDLEGIFMGVIREAEASASRQPSGPEPPPSTVETVVEEEA
ncbi:MAG: ABC transporter ATP-binding protein [Candidatus Promineifilaceae bacterium]|nr:ABC transporter ATP-binding protein [Candidatus Promineifilaceae bacterium]